MKKIIFLSPLGFLVFVWCATAPAVLWSAFDCTDSSVHTITVPYYYDQPGSPTFPYAFQIRPSGLSNSPTVIVLPGGPGATVIGKDPAGFGIPANYNVILTDPRGEGCNVTQGAAFPTDFFKTEYLSRDIASIIRTLNLHNYIVYGISYGTIQGTVLASIAASESITPPKALVLEGPISRSFNDYDDFWNGVQLQWSRVKNQLTPAALDRFSHDPVPAGLTPAEWAGFIQTLLYVSDIPGQGPLLKAFLDPIGSSDPSTVAAATTSIRNLILARQAEGTAATSISQIIFCREITGTFPTSKILTNGNLVISGDACPGLSVTFSQPYDSSNYPLSVPIFYFQGEFDPVVPLAHPAYHFSQHKTAKRSFLFVGGGAHDSLSFLLKYLGCAGAVWNAMAVNALDLDQAVNSCGTPISVVTTEATPAQAAAEPALITSVLPNTASPAGGSDASINGDNFLTGAAVYIGGRAAQNTMVVNTTLITVTLPNGIPGNRTVAILNPDGQRSVLFNGFSYSGGGGPGTAIVAEPNPFRPSEDRETTIFPISLAATVEIYTTNGLLVKNLTATNSGTAIWDGKNKSGETVASGVYLCVVKDNGGKSMVKVVVIR